MNLYKISQTVNYELDTYKEAIVVAENEEQARYIYPLKPVQWHDDSWCLCMPDGFKQYEDFLWCNPKEVTVTLVGTAAETLERGDVVCSALFGC